MSRRDMVLVAAALLVGLALELHFYVGLIPNDNLRHTASTHRLLIAPGDRLHRMEPA
jgi:hypothetical protein